MVCGIAARRGRESAAVGTGLAYAPAIMIDKTRIACRRERGRFMEGDFELNYRIYISSRNQLMLIYVESQIHACAILESISSGLSVT